MTSNSPQYQESDFRIAMASIDLAAEFIVRGKIPKENEQNLLFSNAFNSNSLLTKGFRNVLAEFFAKPDSYFDPLLPFVQDAAEAVTAEEVVPSDIHSRAQPSEALHSKVQEEIRAGRAHKLFAQRPEVERWIADTVDETFSILERHNLLSINSSRQLVHAVLSLRYVYGEILAGLKPYIESLNLTAQFNARNFAATSINHIRSSMMVETVSKLALMSPFQPLLVDFVKLSQQIAEQNLRLQSLSARSHFEHVQRKLMIHSENPGSLLTNLLDLCLWEGFAESGLPSLREFVRRNEVSRNAGTFFVPGQLVVVHTSTHPDEPTVMCGFDSHTGTRSVAAACPDIFGDSFQLSGIGIPESLHFSAKNASGMILANDGKLYPSFTQRFVATPHDFPEEAALCTVRDTLSIIEGKVSALWTKYPDVLRIISEAEPTVVVFEGARCIVLGTALPDNDARAEFFGTSKNISDENVALSDLTFENPTLWCARTLYEPTSSTKEPSNQPVEVVGQQEERRALREVVQRFGQMKYRDFVSHLTAWGAIDTTEGKGGHGSIKRIVDGCELRAGTWGKLRDPDRNMNFARMYEILESLRIPIAEFTEHLQKRS